jgi:hypothetical protein
MEEGNLPSFLSYTYYVLMIIAFFCYILQRFFKCYLKVYKQGKKKTTLLKAGLRGDSNSSSTSPTSSPERDSALPDIENQAEETTPIVH